MLAKAYRFHGHTSLKFVYTAGTTVRSKYFSIKYVNNTRRELSRASVVVAKKVAKRAPERNRIRRRIYELLREQWSMIKPGYDMVITVFDSDTADMPHREISQTLNGLLKNAKLYK